jgi:hypothetical protein
MNRKEILTLNGDWHSLLHAKYTGSPDEGYPKYPIIS